MSMHQEIMCAGKEQYLSRALADKVLRRRKHSGQRRLCVYKCQHCGWWHHGGVTREPHIYRRK